MRALWKGTLAFGRVNMPVTLYSATEEKDLRFYNVHNTDGGRIRHKRICEICGQEIPYVDVVKGYDIGAGELVLLDSDDFADLPLPTARTAEIVEFVPEDQVDPVLYGQAYYLEPDQRAVTPYLLFRDALKDSGKVAIAKIAIRQREHLATVHVRDNLLVMHTLLWPDEVRAFDSPFLTEDIPLDAKDRALAGQLIKAMSGEFTPTEYTDGYREALQEVVTAKIEGREVVAPWKLERPLPDGTDLTTALKESVTERKAVEKKPAHKQRTLQVATKNRKSA